VCWVAAPPRRKQGRKLQGNAGVGSALAFAYLWDGSGKRLPDQDRERKASTPRERQRWQRVFFFLSWGGWWRPVAPVAGVALLACFIAKRGASAADALAVPPRGRPVSAKAAFQRVPAAAQLVRFVASIPKAAEDLRQPLLLAVCFGFHLDCLQAPLLMPPVVE
jgi:hypothetical protein